MKANPQDGRRYIHIFPRSPFFQEIRDCYRSACGRLPWMEVYDLEDWTMARPEWFMSWVVLVFWGHFPDYRAPKRRKCLFAFRFTESVGDPELLAETQVVSMRQFSLRALEPDVVICGNPVVADYWSRLCHAVAVSPAGYEPEILGTPDWESDKPYLISYRGSDIGRRLWITELIASRLEGDFLKIEDYGAARKKALDGCQADLYIGHSSDYAFPGMRLWQAISSSAALITERRNAWPAVSGRHYITLEPAVQANGKRFVDELLYALKYQPLREIARTAYDELSVYTIDRCMDQFLVPALKGLSR